MDANILKACLIRFFGTVFLTMAQTYANMIFLSYYPSNKLPYLFLINGILLFAIKSLTKNFLLQSVRKVIITNNIAYIVCLGVFIIGLHLSLDWTRFALCVALNTIAFCIIADNWLIISKSFNIREFKRIGNWIILSSSMGAIVTGVFIPIILKILPPVFMIYTLMLTLVVLLLLIKSLKIDETVEAEGTTRASSKILNTHPLYVQLFAGLVLTFAIFTIADFCFMSQLTLIYTQVEIGNILAPFYAGVNIIIILLQLFATQKIIQRFTVTGLFFAFPIFIFFASVLMSVFPGFWTAMLVSGTTYIARFSFYSLGQQLAVNVFPESLRYLANYQLQNTGRNVGVGVASGVLITISGFYDLRLLGLVIIFLCGITYYLCRLIKLNYEVNLKHSINLHRYNIDFIASKETDTVLSQEVVGLAMQSDALDVKLFGLSLLQTLTLDKAPSYLLASLKSLSPEIRIAAIRTLKNIKNPLTHKLLTQRVSEEHDPEVMWELLKTLIDENGSSLLPKGLEFIKRGDPRFRACGLLVCIRLDPHTNLEPFMKLMYSTDPKARFWACRVLKRVDFPKADEYVLKLLSDPDLEVCSRAISAAERHYNIQIIDAILEKLNDKQFYPEIRKAFTRIGSAVIPFMAEKIQTSKHIGLIKSLVNILADLPQGEAEEQLMRFLDSKNTFIQENSITKMAYRATKFSLTGRTKAVIKSLMMKEMLLLQQYQLLQDGKESSEFLVEVQTLITISRKKFLYLLAAYTKSSTVIELLPTILRTRAAGPAFHRAIELLDIKIEDRNVVNIIPYALEGKRDTNATRPEITKNFNPWLYRVHEYKIGRLEGKLMEITQRVLVLRKVELLSSLSAEVLEYIAENLVIVDVASGQEIFKEGDAPNGLYIVGKGTVSIMRGTHELHRYESGGFFGELGLFDNEPRTGTAIAKVDSILFLLGKEDFNRLTEDIPEILKVVVKTVIGYIREKQPI